MNPLENLFFFGSSPLSLEHKRMTKVIPTILTYLSNKTLRKGV